MALLSEVQERSWASDKYGDKVERWQWDWRDRRIMEWINNFAKVSREDVMGNVERLDMTQTGTLRRSLAWKTWAASGGNSQVFEARYIYYAKYLELAVGRGEPFRQLPPGITHKAWGPIRMPDRKRRAKPHVVVEMRKQATKFASYARQRFSFVGTMYLIFAMGNNKSASAAYNRAVFWAAKKDAFQR